jgi:hypothetical protein
MTPAALALQSGDPLSLAIAARGPCEQAESDLRKALIAAYIDLDPSVNQEALETARKKVLERNAAEIVAARAANVPPKQ